MNKEICSRCDGQGDDGGGPYSKMCGRCYGTGEVDSFYHIRERITSFKSFVLLVEKFNKLVDDYCLENELNPTIKNEYDLAIYEIERDDDLLKSLF